MAAQTNLHHARGHHRADLERRWEAEARRRAGRLPKGFSGIWHRLTGQYAKIRKQNEREALEAFRRDRAVKDDLIFRQLEERGALQSYIRAERSVSQQRLTLLREDVANYNALERKQLREQNDGMGPEARLHRRERRARQRDFDI
ncbi:hypothetical protein [Pelagibacterium montanilacus]|uniref:hypothetical protein n=1 Tax=Pelagibacterium montanilacus TaxID=2185280 RepID=UPI000F8ED8D3|nr:hypothetical protein [Pelagibacterium montanilacus]